MDAFCVLPSGSMSARSGGPVPLPSGHEGECPACRAPFSERRRPLVDACGHPSCSVCVFSHAPCMQCSSEVNNNNQGLCWTSAMWYVPSKPFLPFEPPHLVLLPQVSLLLRVSDQLALQIRNSTSSQGQAWELIQTFSVHLKWDLAGILGMRACPGRGPDLAQLQLWMKTLGPREILVSSGPAHAFLLLSYHSIHLTSDPKRPWPYFGTFARDALMPSVFVVFFRVNYQSVDSAAVLLREISLDSCTV